MAAQGEADYLNRREMQKQGIAKAQANGKDLGRPKVADAAEVVAWRAWREHREDGGELWNLCGDGQALLCPGRGTSISS
jgi:DNA invertase Pin-like site-specific DNA recombinase